jgi:hypothetical protein
MKPQAFLRIVTTSITITLTCVLMSHSKPAAWWHMAPASPSAHEQIRPETGVADSLASSVSQWQIRASLLIPSHWATHSGEAVEEAHHAGTNWRFWSDSWLRHDYIGHLASKAASGLWLGQPLFDCGGQVG